jgi:hypothetical protein
MSRFTIDKLKTITEENFASTIKEIAPNWTFDAGKRPICGVETFSLQRTVSKGTRHESTIMFTYITGFWVKDSETQKTFIPITWDTTSNDDAELGKYIKNIISSDQSNSGIGDVRGDVIQLIRFWSLIPWIKKNYDIMADTLLNPALKASDYNQYKEQKQMLLDMIRRNNGFEQNDQTNQLYIRFSYETIHFDQGYYLAGYGVEFNRNARMYIVELLTTNASGNTKTHVLITSLKPDGNAIPIANGPDFSGLRFGFKMNCKPSKDLNLLVYKHKTYAATNKIFQMHYPIPYSFLKSFSEAGTDEAFVKTECNVEESSTIDFVMIFILCVVFAGIVVAIMLSSSKQVPIGSIPQQQQISG